jgi:para-nitrobenzyl esterase
LQAAAKLGRAFGFGPNIDGYFLPTDMHTIYAQGAQSHVPLLAGWNADEGKMMVLYSPQKPTAQSFADQARERFGDQAGEFLKLFSAKTDQEAMLSAEALANDDFIVFSTWKWTNMQVQTGKSPVYQYHFDEVPATKPGAMAGPIPASELGSKHAGEIEYLFQTLKSQEGVPWTEDDFKVSDAMSSYWANFVKSGDPNGGNLPKWPPYDSQDQFQVMRLLGSNIHSAPEPDRARFEFFDAQSKKTMPKSAGASE